MAAINQKTFDKIRKAAKTYQGTIAQLAAEQGSSERTVRRILAAKNWTDYRERTVAASHKAQAARKARAEAEKTIPHWESSGLFEGTTGATALEDDLVIQNPDAPAEPEQIGITDEIHEMRPKPLDTFEVSGLSDMTCDRIHALSRVPAAIEIITKAVAICPESIGTIVNALYFPLCGKKMI